MKIYHRYKYHPDPESLVPQKRGPRFKTRRIDLALANEIVSHRLLGNNRYEIRQILKPTHTIVPSSTTIYNVCKRHVLNRLHKKEKQERRKIIMSKIGEPVHVDGHQLSKDITIDTPDKTFWLLGLLDDYSRVAWVEVLEDMKALTVMFVALKAFNILNNQYHIEIDTLMSDNGSEFGG
jgi:transposase InsO family protein